jgi:hypothetical protein
MLRRHLAALHALEQGPEIVAHARHELDRLRPWGLP